MSNYRDDRDALHGRVQTLEEELAATHKELEESRRLADGTRVDELEQRMGDARRVIEGMQRELEALRPKRREMPSGVPIAVGAIGVVFLGAVGLVALRSRPRPLPPPPGAPTQPVLATPTRVTPAPPTAPAPPRRTEVARFAAKVSRATGAAPAVGSTCTIEAKVGGNGASLGVDELEVVCGETTLYRSTDPLEGVSMSSSNVEEEPAPGGAQVYAALLWEDKGARSGARAQVSIASHKRAASVWTDSAPSFHVDLVVEPRSAPVAGPALHDGTNLALRTSAVASAVTGPAPVKKGASCTVFAVPAAPKCPLRIECGGVTVYGAAGSIAPCTLEDGLVVTASDPEGTAVDRDPAMSLDVRERHARVWDGEGPRAWSVDLDLAKADRGAK